MASASCLECAFLKSVCRVKIFAIQGEKATNISAQAKTGLRARTKLEEWATRGTWCWSFASWRTLDWFVPLSVASVMGVL